MRSAKQPNPQENPLNTPKNLHIPIDAILQGDSLAVLKTLPDNSVHCCVTSPPYYALRDYGVEGQIGREATPEAYIRRLVEVFREVYRVLRKDGTFWLNISDTYCKHTRQSAKVKDMLGIPWRLALALREDGWYLRSDVIWEKGNAMPESVVDRCSRCYEHVFQLTKAKRYHFDRRSIAEPVSPATLERLRRGRSGGHKYAACVPGQTIQTINLPRKAGSVAVEQLPTHRNKRDVWHISTSPYSGAHFAAFPPKLAETCILAGCPAGGVVLDPFFGSGTTGLAAKNLGRHYIGIEINPAFCKLAEGRIQTAAQKRRDTAREKSSADGYASRDKTAPAPSVAATGARQEATP